MDRLKTGFNFLFSSYKTAAGLLVVMAIILAIPVTVSFLGEQQDIRQQASTSTCTTLVQSYIAAVSSRNVDTNALAQLRTQLNTLRCTTSTLPTPPPSNTTTISQSATCQAIQNSLSLVQQEGICTMSQTTCTTYRNLLSQYGCTTTSTTQSSSPTPTGAICAQIITFARNTTTSACQQFPTSCLPQGWVPDSSCQNATPTPASTSSSCTSCSTRSPFSCTYTILGRTSTFCSPINLTSGFSCTRTCTSPTSTPGASVSPTVVASTLTPTSVFPSVTLSPTPIGNLSIAPTNISIAIQITGIGSTTGLNSQPKRSTRPIKLEIINAQNIKAAELTSNATFDGASGRYKANFTAQLASGPYLLRVKLDNTLSKLIPGTQVITAGSSYTAPAVGMISGDVNGDNEINLIDYNLMMACIAKSGICTN